MNVLEAALRRVSADLARHGVKWALVGGFAVSARAEPRFTRDVDVAVALTGHLIALKLLARDDAVRPQDLADLRALSAAASQSDLWVARDAVALISGRGYDRGRDLSAALTALDGAVG